MYGARAATWDSRPPPPPTASKSRAIPSSAATGTLNILGASTLQSTLDLSGAITSTATAANTLPYASSTALTVSGTGYLGTASPTNLTVSALTSGRVPYITTAGAFTDSANLTFDGALLTLTGNLSATNATKTALFSPTASSTNFFSNSATIGSFTGGTGAFSSTLSVTGASTFTGLGTFESGYVSQASSTVLRSFTTTGNVTFGGTLTVNGLCVSADTRLRRRRKNAKGEYEYDEPEIIDIEEGDEIQSLDEKTGRLVWSRVKQLAFMGVKQTYRITTEDGRSIRTTANHPYLTR